MKISKSHAFLFAAFFLLLTHQDAKAQYVVASSSISYNASNNTVTSYSATDMDYYTYLYYQAATEGYLTRPSDGAVLSSGSSTSAPGHTASAIVHTQATGAPSTTYAVQGRHHVGTLYQNLNYGGVICGNFYRFNDVFSYSRFWPGSYGPSVTFYGAYPPTCLASPFIYLGTTGATVATPPLTISITSPRVGGNLHGTMQNALPGADISLQANVNYGAGTFSWSFSGPHAVVGGAVNSSQVTIRATDAGVISATATYTRSGVSTSAAFNINSDIPTLTNFAQSQGSEIVMRPWTDPCPGASNRWMYRLGCGQQTANRGTNYSATAQAPGSLISDPAQSGIKLVQIANAFRKRRYKGNNECKTRRTVSETDIGNGWESDGDPYGATSQQLDTAVRRFSQGNPVTITAVDYPTDSMGDPIIGVEDLADAIYVDEHFEGYVSYFAGGDPAAPVFQRVLRVPNSPSPVARIAWRWGGQAAYEWNPSSDSAVFKTQYTLQPPTSNPAVGVASMRPIGGQGLPHTWGPCPGAPPPTTNPIDWTRFFVQTHYRDFFNRDDLGDYWTTAITFCGFDLDCIRARRIAVSRSFMYSGEFIAMHPELNAPRGTHDYNAAFVILCYQTYLRRNPNDPPDNNWDGFNHWVGVLDSTNPDASDSKYDHIVQAFIESIEYRHRFGQ